MTHSVGSDEAALAHEYTAAAVNESGHVALAHVDGYALILVAGEADRRVSTGDLAAIDLVINIHGDIIALDGQGVVTITGSDGSLRAVIPPPPSLDLRYSPVDPLPERAAIPPNGNLDEPFATSHISLVLRPDGGHPLDPPRDGTNHISLVLGPGGELRAHTHNTRLSISRDGKLVFAPGQDGNGRVIDVAAGSVVQNINTHPVATISPDGRAVAEPSKGDYRVAMTRSADGIPMPGWCPEANFERIAYALAWAPDGTSVVLSGWQKYDYTENREKIYLAQPEDPDLHVLVAGPEEFHRLCFNDGGDILGYATADDVVGVFFMDSWQHVDLAQMQPAVIGIGFAGGRFYAADMVGRVATWALDQIIDRKARRSACVYLRE